MRVSKLVLLPLLSLTLLTTACDTSSDENVPAPTVISNEEAVEELGENKPSTTEAIPAPAETSPIAVEGPTSDTGGSTASVEEATLAPEDVIEVPPTAEPAP